MSKTSGGWLLRAAAVVPFFFATVYFRTRHLELEAVTYGLSPLQVAAVSAHPQWFATDFPSGALETLKSIVFWIYPFAEKLGLNILAVWSAMIALELGLVLIGIFIIFRLLFPALSWQAACAAALSYAASSINAPDLARFALPFYGWNYGFASVAALAVVALTVRRRFIAAALALVVAMMIHPIFAAFSALFAAVCLGVQIWQERHVPAKSLGIAAVIAVCGCGAWLALLSSQGTITGGAIEPGTFVALTRAQNYHWFPFYLGVFWELHANHFLPLISTLALIAWSVSRPRYRGELVSRQLATGVAVLMAVCLCGVAISALVPSPTLIKLALHRADTMALLAGGLLVTRALWCDLDEGDAVERTLAAYILLLPFLSDVGFVPLPVAVRIAYAGWKAFRGRETSPALFVAIALAILALGLIACYRFAGIVPDLGDFRYAGYHPLLMVAAAVGLSWPWLVARFAGRFRLALSLPTLALLAMGTTAAARSQRFDLMIDPTARMRAEHGKAAQLWAKGNTPAGALFMVDPASSYFWRDLSQRPSFGTAREWLLISIMYNSRRDLLDEGLRRYAALGLPFPDYIYDASHKRMGPLLNRIIEEPSQRYNALTHDGFRKLAADFGIRYFVFDAARLKGDPPVEVVFRNPGFIIGRAPD